MPTTAVENLIVSSIHGAFIKYPEGDGGPNLDYEWIAPDQSAHIAKAILLDLARQWLCDCEAGSVTHLGQCSFRSSTRCLLYPDEQTFASLTANVRNVPRTEVVSYSIDSSA